MPMLLMQPPAVVEAVVWAFALEKSSWIVREFGDCWERVRVTLLLLLFGSLWPLL